MPANRSVNGSLIRPFASHAVVRSDGSIGMVDTLGQPMPDDTKIVVAAGALAKLLAEAAIVGVRLGSEATATVALQAGAAAVRATAKSAAQAGVEAGAQYAMTNSRVRLAFERDAAGHIVGTVETREPLP